MSLPAASDPARVLAHDRWLRALARGLVADPASAEDLAQESWVQALEHEPEGGSIHGWLRTTVRNLAASLRRANARRARRERAAARPERLPSAEELREGEAVRRAVADAVLALDEPYRTTVALRFFEGLPPRAVARCMGVPVETVRTRIKRALEQLRARLDAEQGGRGAWCQPLAPLAAPISPLASLAGGLLVTLQTKLAAAALAAIALSLVVWSVWPVSGATPPATGIAVASAPSAAAEVPPASAPPRAAVEPAPSTGLAAARATGSLLVRVRWHDGTPAAGVAMRVYASPRDELRPTDLDARTDATGEARVGELAPGRYGVMLDRRQYASATIEAGRQAELTLQTGGTQSRPSRAVRLRGTVVTWEGAPVADAEVLLGPVAMERSRPLVATRTASDGTFELREVEPDTWIEARAPGYAPSLRNGGLFLIAVGQRRAGPEGAELRLVLPALGGSVAGVVVDSSGKPVADAVVQVGVDHGLFPEIATRDGTAAAHPSPQRLRSDAEGRFACSAIAAGSCNVAVRAPGFGVWSGTVAVSAGRESTVRVELVPGVTLRGTARDSLGTALEGIAVHVGDRGTFAGAEAKSRTDGTFELRGLGAGTLEATASGGMAFAAGTRLVARAGDALTWDPVLEVAKKLAGRVIDERGKPVAAMVRARSTADANLYGETRTDAAGCFELARWRDVSTQIDVVVERGGQLPSARADDARPGTEVVITVRDADVPSAIVTGTLLGPEGAPADEASVWATQPGHPRGAQGVFPDPGTGRFRAGPLPDGDWRITLSAKGCATRFVRVPALGTRETRELGTLTLQRPGALEVVATGGDTKPGAWKSWILDDDRGDFAGFVVVRDGEGECRTLAPGKYVLQASWDGAADARHPFTIGAGETTRLEVKLAKAPVTRLVVTAPPSDPSLELRLRVTDANGTVMSSQRVTRPHRSVPFEVTLGLLPGKHSIEASTAAGASGSLEADVTDQGRDQTVRIDMR